MAFRTSTSSIHGRDGATTDPTDAEKRVTLRWVVASVHLLALGIGLGAIAVRARALRGVLDTPGLRRVLRADAFWGIAALLWISTGVARAFFGLEKGAAYYLGSTAFLHKMLFLALILVLEISPALTFARWRGKLRRGEPVDTGRAVMYSRISIVQLMLVILMVFAATAVARGLYY